ncbi:UvrD-helicase domain-containing protein [uncultured Ruegeria sp.]|uniref:UvrD-helicase domain-containing protein n=1 Tax=uncultured Ruegeria sp. TaxID=259304 RepID=UPI002609FE63|nr:UvrD-helicase domain-containing protein [uncultured Ruegeria sp.]
MPDAPIDLLSIERGTITAPAGCGKTHLIAEALARHRGAKPVLILTHTNAGVAALRNRLSKAGVPTSAFRLMTIDGWAIRLLSMFPERAGADPSILQATRPSYPRIREAARTLLKEAHLSDIIAANYDRLIVDEYQDCSVPQHAIVFYAARALRTVVLGDPMQAIFNWPGNVVAPWDDMVCKHFPLLAELDTPWRWKNADSEELGQWLLDTRTALIRKTSIDLRTAPLSVQWFELDGSDDYNRQLEAARTTSPEAGGSVLVIGNSKKPQSHRDFAARTPGAITVECPSSEFFGELRRFRNGGSGSISV